MAATAAEACDLVAAAPGRRGLLVPSPLGAPDGVAVLVAGEDPAEYARVLYASLHRADDLGLDLLVAVPPPEEGLGLAIADRLRRAAGGGGA